MRTQRLASPLVALVLGQFSAHAQQWQPAPDVISDSGARSYAAAIVDGQTLYSIGGRPFVGAGDSTTVFSFQEGNGAWTQLAAMEGQIIAQGAGIDALGRILVFAGEDAVGGDTGNNRVYDPIEGFTGDRLPDRPGDPPFQGFAFCTDAQGRLYSLGGGAGEDFGTPGPASDLAARYDALSDSWSALAPLPLPVAWACAVDDGLGHVLVIGGVNADASARTAEVQRFDLATGQWSTTAAPDLPIALSDAAAARGADGRVYVVGGRTGPMGLGATIRTVHVLDPQSNTWTRGPDLSTPRRNLGAAVLPANDGGYLYAIGGENESGGTVTCEKLFTSACPTVLDGFDEALAWHGAPGSIAVDAIGGGTLSYQWYRDGVALADGTKPSGGVYDGATTPELLLDPALIDDAGLYECVVSNDCGDTPETGALRVRLPASIPHDGGRWTVQEIHPQGATSSRITGIDGDSAVGSANFIQDWNGGPLDIARPYAWMGDAWIAVDLTPADSVGGAALGVAGDRAVGWFWHVYDCFPGQCAWQSAGFWDLPSGAFTERHASGAEYSRIADISGDRMVGSATFEYSQGNYETFATIHEPPNYWPRRVADVTFSSVDGDAIFGGVFAGGSHARRWDAASLRVLDMEPQGVSASFVQGAGDGQAVGSVQTESTRAAFWTGGRASFADLTPPTQRSSRLRDSDGGLQVGSTSPNGADGQGHAAIWGGTSDSWFDLHTLVSNEFTSSEAFDVDVRVDGTIVVVGTGYRASADRQEALLWIAQPQTGCPADLDADGDADADDVFAYLDLFAANNPAADLDADGDTDADDFFAYLDLFVSGC